MHWFWNTSELSLPISTQIAPKIQTLQSIVQMLLAVHQLGGTATGQLVPAPCHPSLHTCLRSAQHAPSSWLPWDVSGSCPVTPAGPVLSLPSFHCLNSGTHGSSRGFLSLSKSCKSSYRRWEKKKEEKIGKKNKKEEKQRRREQKRVVLHLLFYFPAHPGQQGELPALPTPGHRLPGARPGRGTGLLRGLQAQTGPNLLQFISIGTGNRI